MFFRFLVSFSFREGAALQLLMKADGFLRGSGTDVRLLAGRTPLHRAEAGEKESASLTAIGHTPLTSLSADARP